MATIQKRVGKSGKRYRVMVRRKGARPLSKTFGRKADAEAWALRTEASIERGEVLQAEARRYTVSGMIQRYIEEILPDRRQESQSSIRHMLQFWDDQIGHLTLGDLNPARVADAKSVLLKATNRYGRPFAPATVNNYLTTFSGACRLAVREWRILPKSPMPDVSRPKIANARVRFLSPDDELPRLLAACKAECPRLHFLVLFALATGARRGELLALRWGNVDLERGVVAFLHTKNGTHRGVPLIGQALEVARIRSRDKLPTDLVFASSQTRPESKAVSFDRKAWMRARHAAGIEDFRFHDLRHTNASFLAMSGATTRELAESLGHKTLGMVMRYSHLAPDHNRPVVARMADRFLSVESQDAEPGG